MILINLRKRFVNFTLMQLLERNIHLGSYIKFSLLTSYWFIFGIRQNFTIIDLSKTLIYLRKTIFLIEIGIKMKYKLLFVNYKKFVINNLEFLLKSCGEPFIFSKWVNGILTNYKKMWKTYNKLKGVTWRLSEYDSNLKKILKNICFSPIMPSLIFVVNIRYNYISAKEAFLLKLPVISLLDTDISSNFVLYGIPANDDSSSSIFFFFNLFIKLVIINKLELIIKMKKIKGYYYNQYQKNKILAIKYLGPKEKFLFKK